MAEKSEINRHDRKAELISELQWARAELSGSVRAARSDLNLVAHLKQSVVRQKTTWFVGAAISGWIISRLPWRKKPAKAKELPPHVSPQAQSEKMRTGLFLATLNVLFTVFKPALTALVSRKLTDFAARNDQGWRKPHR